MRCPTEQALSDFALGRAAPPELEAVAAHAETCPYCQEVLARLDEAADSIMRGLRGSTCVSPADSTLVRPQPPETFPTCIGDYRVEGLIGRGAMGVVYLARRRDLERSVAVKVAFERHDPDLMERLRTEAVVVGRLNHPNIVQVHDAGAVDGRPFLVLEHVAGGTLEDRLAAGPLPVPEALRIVEAVARALHHAHAVGVVHRDLKPSNVLLTGDGTPKVTDFGLAKDLSRIGATHTGWVLGTPGYMAPEQAEGRPRDVTPVTDVYALGALFYATLTGRPPFDAPTVPARLLQVVSSEPVAPSRLRPDLPRDLEAICLKCLEREPHRRYGSAEGVAEDLARFRRGEPVQARPIGSLARLRRLVARRPLVAALMAALGIGLVAGLAVTGYLWQKADEARAQAEVKAREAADGRRAALQAIQVLVNRTRDELGQNPGLLDASRRILETAEAELERVPRGDDPTLAYDSTRVMILWELGDVLRQYPAEFATAGRKLAEALQTAERVAAERPDDLVATFFLATALSRYGHWLREDDQPAAAADHLERELPLREALRARDPQNRTRRHLLARAHAELARAYSALDRPDDMDRVNRAAIELLDGLLGEPPSSTQVNGVGSDPVFRFDERGLNERQVRRELVEVLTRAAAQYRKAGRLAEARRLYPRLAAEAPRLTEHPDPAAPERRLQALALLEAAVGSAGLARNPAVERALAQAVAAFADLARGEPANPIYRRDRALALTRAADVYNISGQQDKAEECLDEAVAEAEAVFAATPAYRRSAIELAETLDARFVLLRVRGKFDAAANDARRMLTVLEALPAEQQDARRVRLALATAHHRLGLVHELRAEWSAAEVAYQRQLAGLTAVFPGDHPEVFFARRSLAKLYRSAAWFDDALPLLRQPIGRLEEIGHNEPAARWVRRELLLGHFLLGEVHAARGEFVDAIRHLDRAAAAAANLGGGDESSAMRQVQIDLSRSRGRVWLLAKRPDLAARVLHEGLEIARKQAAGAANNSACRVELAQQLLLIGRLKETASQPIAEYAEAAELLKGVSGGGRSTDTPTAEQVRLTAALRQAVVDRAAERASQTAVQLDSCPSATELAKAIGHATAARVGEGDTAAQHRLRALAHLRAALERGECWHRAGVTGDPDLAAVLGHPDGQDLLAALGRSGRP